VFEADRQVDRGEGRRQEPEEGQADLGDREEASRLGDELLDPPRIAVALLGRRMVTRAISAATKMASRKVRMTMTRSWRMVSI
jgi:hypothetical protein